MGTLKNDIIQCDMGKLPMPSGCEGVSGGEAARKAGAASRFLHLLGSEGRCQVQSPGLFQPIGQRPHALRQP